MKFFRKGKLSLSQESLRYDGDLKTLKGKRGLTKKVVESPEYHRPHIKKGILRFRTLCLLLKFLTSVPTYLRLKRTFGGKYQESSGKFLSKEKGNSELGSPHHDYVPIFSPPSISSPLTPSFSP